MEEVPAVLDVVDVEGAALGHGREGGVGEADDHGLAQVLQQREGVQLHEGLAQRLWAGERTSSNRRKSERSSDAARGSERGRTTGLLSTSDFIAEAEKSTHLAHDRDITRVRPVGIMHGREAQTEGLHLQARHHHVRGVH